MKGKIGHRPGFAQGYDPAGHTQTHTDRHRWLKGREPGRLGKTGLRTEKEKD